MPSQEVPYWGARKIRGRLLHRFSCEVKIPRCTFHVTSYGFVGLPRCRNDLADFLHSEESSFGLDLGRNARVFYSTIWQTWPQPFAVRKIEANVLNTLGIIFRDKFAWARFVSVGIHAWKPVRS